MGRTKKKKRKKRQGVDETAPVMDFWVGRHPWVPQGFNPSDAAAARY